MPESLVVGLLYPTEWNNDLDAHVERLEAVDPSVEVVVEPYVESSELRSGRGVPPYGDVRHLAPELTAAQRAAFARIECCLTLDLPFDVAALAPRLRWVQALGAGVGQLQSAGLAEAGIRLTNASGVTATAIAEFVMSRILAVYKRHVELADAQRARRWESLFGDELAGRTIGLLGFGPINQGVARRARAFEMRVVALRRSGAPSELADAVVGPDGLAALLAQSDVVVAALPETPETEGLMDAAAFASMKEGSMFVNVGRGTLVDEDALAAALRDGPLRAAAIDVARVEPLPSGSALWDAPNLAISAHCSTAPDRMWDNVHALFEDNLRRYLAGEPLRNEIVAASGG